MKGKAISSLSKANSKSKLAREGANAKRNKRGVVRRSNYSGGLSSSKSISQFNAGGSIASSMRSSGNQELSAKQKKQQQRINNAIKITEKIPFLNKYEKIAKAAEKVAAIKGKGGKILGSGSQSASTEEAEDMLAAEQRGEEYKPDQTEQKFTVFTNRQLIITTIMICSGIFIILILISVITMSSITDTAGEAYLASKDTPTEEELADAYGALDGASSSSSSSESSGNIKSDSTSNLIMVGDSRFVGVCTDAYNGAYSDCSTIGYKKDNVTFIAKIGESYQWLKNSALAEVKKQLDANKKSTVFINLGTNGLDDTDNYAATYNQLAKDYPESNIVAVNVPPIIDEYTTDYRDVENDANVVKFNAALKTKLSSDVIYCDVYSKLKGKVNAPDDGVHYDEKSSKLFNDEMLNCIKNTGNSSSSSSFDSLLSKGGTSVSDLENKKINQLVIVESNGSTANVSFYEKESSGWKVDSSLNTSGYVGSNGTTSSPSEGKSATPKGLYGVGDAFYQSSVPSTKLNSFKITSNTYWVDDPNSKYYNQKVEGTANKDWSSAEHMSEISSYKYGFVINYNMNPVKKGAGSAIFFHVSHVSPTAGCVSVPESMVLSYLSKLDKSKNPYILII